MKPCRPVLRYHGGKWKIAPWILSHFPEHRIYVEPFCGAASLLMHKPRAYAEVINDLDGEVVNVFRVLRNRELAAELERQLRLTPWSRKEFWAAYDPADDPVEQARRTIVRVYMAFGTTGRRRNRSGFRAAPYRLKQSGVNDWLNYPRAISSFVERLQRVTVEQRPALDIIHQQDSPVTLFYCDPPYPFSTRTSVQWPSHNDRAYIHDMTDDEHRELAEVLHAIKGMAIISGYPCDLYDRELYFDWRRAEMTAWADQGKQRTEVLWISPNVPARHIELFEVTA
jgi:DNA adenine methylase